VQITKGFKSGLKHYWHITTEATESSRWEMLEAAMWCLSCAGNIYDKNKVCHATMSVGYLKIACMPAGKGTFHW